MTTKLPDNYDLLPWDEKIIQVDGHDMLVATWSAKTAASSRQPVIVLLHGFGSDHYGLDPLVAELTGYRVIALDIPGYGQSVAPTGGASLANMAELIVKFLNEGGAGSNYSLVGHSMGAAVGLIVAAQAPQGLQEVLLFNLPCDNQVWSARLAQLYYALAQRLPLPIRARIIRSWGMLAFANQLTFRTGGPRERAFIMRQDRLNVAGLDPDVVLSTFRSAADVEFGEVAGRVMVPTTLVAGGEDIFVGLPAIKNVEAALATSQALIVYPKAGHLFPIEEPEEAARLIMNTVGSGRSSKPEKPKNVAQLNG